jgi:hypothetical protein
MEFKSGDRVEIINGPHKNKKNCFVQRAATPEDNLGGRGPDRSGKYLVNFGNSTFIPGWEAGFWADPDELLRESQRVFIERDLLNHLVKQPLANSASIYLVDHAQSVLLDMEVRGLVEHTLVGWLITQAGREYLPTLYDVALFEPDYDAHIVALEKAHGEALDQAEEDRADAPSSWDPDSLVVYSSTNDRQADLIFNEREFLLDIVDNPLPALFEKHLRHGAAEAFEMFKREGFVELAVIDDRYHITNKGRLRLGLEVDPTL